MNNKIQQPTKYFSPIVKIVLCIAFMKIITLCLPNEWDGFYLDNDSYVYGVNDIMAVFAFVLFVNICLFSSEIIAKCKQRFCKAQDVDTVNVPKYKIVICIISLVYLILAITSVKIITVKDDSIAIKSHMLASENFIKYEDLKEIDLFVCDDNDVYWGKSTTVIPNGVSSHYDYDLYLGKAENVGELIEQINEKSGRQLKYN